jgi:hypothetical protein
LFGEERFNFLVQKEFATNIQLGMKIKMSQFGKESQVDMLTFKTQHKSRTKVN